MKNRRPSIHRDRSPGEGRSSAMDRVLIVRRLLCIGDQQRSTGRTRLATGDLPQGLRRPRRSTTHEMTLHVPSIAIDRGSTALHRR